MTIRFDDKVAIVTGAGGGLGREYALALAARGAKVMVNDLGGARDGTGHSDAALKVVEEIKAAGGEAMSNGGSVTEYEQMVEMVAKAKEAWGGVHILINNAGVLRDKSFANMEPADFKFVVDVHLNGSANCTKAVWATMREQAYGRILMTASSTGPSTETMSLRVILSSLTGRDDANKRPRGGAGSRNPRAGFFQPAPNAMGRCKGKSDYADRNRRRCT